MKDPLVEEIRNFRLEHSKRFGYNIEDICNDLRSFEKSLRAKIDIDENNIYSNKSLNTYDCVAR